MKWALLVLAAAATATVSGILGMAGGIALLGAMAALLAPAEVVPLHGVVQLTSNFTRTLAFLRDVRWRIFLIYAGPLAVGVGAAMAVWSGQRLGWFRPAIGAFLLLFLAWRRWSPKLRNPPLWIYVPLGGFVGFLTIFVGATGPFLAPFFFRDDFAKEEVVATKAVCQSWAHLLKLPAFLAVGFDYLPHWKLLAAMIAAVIAGTFLGKAILKRLPERAFTLLFEAVLGGLGIYLLLRAAVS